MLFSSYNFTHPSIPSFSPLDNKWRETNDLGWLKTSPSPNWGALSSSSCTSSSSCSPCSSLCLSEKVEFLVEEREGKWELIEREGEEEKKRVELCEMEMEKFNQK